MNRISSPAIRLLTLALVAASPFVGCAQSLPLAVTNVAEAKAEGAVLVKELLAQKPVEGFVQTGTLKIRAGDGKRSEHHVRFSNTVTPTNWRGIYFVELNDSGVAQLEVGQTPGQPGKYRYGQTTSPNASALPLFDVSIPEAATRAFAGSDFSFTDLGLEFFHWPEQRLIRKEICRTRSCRVLESINPQPTTNSYAKVRSWIDRESLGIVFAEAYDANGKLLKEFSPKGMKKVNGRWELSEMEMRNVQTRSRSNIEFHPATGP